MTDALTRRQRYDIFLSQGKTERASFDAHWKDIAEHLFPVRARFTLTEANKGQRRNQKILDATATRASWTLQSGLHAGMTSPAKPWMKLITPDPRLTQYEPVKRWLHEVTARMHVVYQLSNLYNALPTLYGDIGMFGTAAMAVLDDASQPGQPGDLFRCYVFPPGSYVMALDQRGIVNTFAREYPMTVAQVVETFGSGGQRLSPGQTPEWSRFSAHIKDQWDKGNYETIVDVAWIVTPNREQNTSRIGPEALPWSSCHYELGRTNPAGTFLRESGFHEMPVLCPRWHVNMEDVYGTDCPGMTALGDVRALQMMQRRKGQAIEKLINPPLQGPTSLRTQKVSLLPGDVTHVDVSQQSQGLRPIHEVRPDLQWMIYDINDTRQAINESFHVPLFRMLSTPDPNRGSQPVTAREVQELHEEKLIALGPVLERFVDELLDPLVDRVFAMMDRAGLIPEPPPELEGVILPAEYISILAQAQKMAGVAAQDRFVASVAAIPEARHMVNGRALIRSYQDKLGIDPGILRTDEEVDALASQEAQAMQQAAQAEQFAKVGQGAKALAQAPVQGDTALARALEGMQQS